MTPRFGYRTRLAMMIAGIFIAGGAVLLTVQYLLVSRLFDSGIEGVDIKVYQDGGDIVGSIASGTGPTQEDAAEFVVRGDFFDGYGTVQVGVGEIEDLVSQQAVILSERVLSGLLTWSIAILAVFALLAVVAARWLSGRSLSRISQITAAARAISQEDMHRRLDLPGPRDEIKELGDTIDGMLSRLDDAFTRQWRFVAGASHELRTPLTLTRAALEIPLEQGRVPAELQAEIRHALEANERSESLIAALMVLARTPHTTESAELISLHDLAQEAIESQAQAARDRGISIDNADHSSTLIRADVALMEIAVGNLIRNAISHNLDGGSVRICCESNADAAWIEISNDGRTLDDDEVSQLTEPFNRGSDSRLAGGGVGLGLTVVDAIVRHQRGALTLTARPEGGLTARCEFGVPDRCPDASLMDSP